MRYAPPHSRPSSSLLVMLIVQLRHFVLTLHLDLVLNNEGLSLVVNLLGEFGRNGVMGSCVLDNETFITLHTLEDVGLLYSPFSNISPFFFLFARTLCVFLGVGWLPSCFPVIGELFNEVAGNLGRL